MLKSITFQYADTSEFWGWFHKYIEFRKKQFVDRLEWRLWHNEAVEIDQYDNPNTFYAMVTDGTELVAAARLIPSGRDWYGWHNLLVDAEAGRVPSIAPGILPRGYDLSDTWECSRLVAVPQETAAMRIKVFKLLVGGLVTLGQQNGARALLSLSPPALRRSLLASGYAAQVIGPPYKCGEDGRNYRVLEMPIAQYSGSFDGFPVAQSENPHNDGKRARFAVPS